MNEKPRIYLDNCCFNRKYDDQSQIIVRLEALAITSILEEVKNDRFELVWSYILDEENDANPSLLKKRQIRTWKTVAAKVVAPSEEIALQAENFEKKGLKSMDALHLSCAMFSASDSFITTDGKILKKKIGGILIENPLVFVQRMLELSNG